MRHISLSAAFALLVGAAVIGPARAGDADFTLKNRTGYQIDEVYISGHHMDSWGSDIMGKGALADSQDVNITFPHGGGHCHFDIKVKYHDDNSSAEWSDVDLCQYEAISLFWDAKEQSTRAVGE